VPDAQDASGTIFSLIHTTHSASALAALSGFAIGGLIKARFGQPRPYLIEPPDLLHRVGGPELGLPEIGQARRTAGRCGLGCCVLLKRRTLWQRIPDGHLHALRGLPGSTLPHLPFVRDRLLRFLAVFLTGDRGFESISLQRGVWCEPDFLPQKCLLYGSHSG
jgi:hypothetical protein